MSYPVRKEIFVSQDMNREFNTLKEWYMKVYKHREFSDSAFGRELLRLGIIEIRKDLRKVSKRKF